MTNVFPPPVNPAIIILFTKPVFIKSKYELIYSKHTLIAESCSLYEASIYVGFFLKFTTGYQSKGSSIVKFSNSSRELTWHLPCVSPSSQITAWTISFFNYFLISQNFIMFKKQIRKLNRWHLINSDLFINDDSILQVSSLDNKIANHTLTIWEKHKLIIGKNIHGLV